jgi:cleavage and polyadenylation specificity factor subunit 1
MSCNQISRRREVESIQGAKLLCISDFHLGSEITMSINHTTLSAPYNAASKMTASDASKLFGARMVKSSPVKSCVVIGTMDGSIGLFIPVEERIYKRLNLLQHLMIMSMKSVCALNPKDYRLFKSNNFRWEKKKGILDGTILWRFISLPTSLQQELAATMGTSVDIILENLYEMNLMSQHF